MSRTIRKKDGVTPRWIESDREKHRYHGDSYNHDSDANPPKWFKNVEKRKFRHNVNQEVRTQDDPVIDRDFHMPYYT